MEMGDTMTVIRTVVFGVLLTGLAMVKASGSMNAIQKVYHHTGTLSDKVTFYLTNNPVCNQLPEHTKPPQAGWTVRTYLLPMTEIKGSVKKQVRAINHAQDKQYAVSIESVTRPIQGVKVTLAYDPRFIECDHSTYTAITSKPAALFTLYRIERVKQAGQQHNGIRRFAACKKKSHSLLLMPVMADTTLVRSVTG